MSAEEWPPATFTAPLRGTLSGYEPTERWQRVAAHEQSLAYKVVRAALRLPLIGRALRADTAAPGPWRPLVDRERDVERVIETPLYRRAEAIRASPAYDRVWRRVRRRPAAGESPPATRAVPHESRALPDPHHVDEALDLLRRVPFQELQRRGWHLQPNHYYWPLNDVRFLRAHPELWHDRPLPPAIDWDLDGQVRFARSLSVHYGELGELPTGKPANMGAELSLDNGSFSGADACAYYGVIRARQPRRVVEVGAGWSTIFLAEALARNDAKADVVLIEPEPDRRLLSRLPADWDIRRSLLQFVDLSVFDALGPGDVCFYDGSHVARAGSDVNWFLFEVLPRLKPGVMVHVHDIYWPDDYHDQWVYGDGLSWNEQYVLQAFLMHNSAYRVRLANHMLFRTRDADVRKIYPSWPDGGSVWVEKTGGP